LLFGDRRIDCFNKAWTDQGFYFNAIDGLHCGLVQIKGGPCGVIAAVQAHVLKHLLFQDRQYEREENEGRESGRESRRRRDEDQLSRPNSEGKNWSHPTQLNQERALLNAFTEILWRIAKASSSGGTAPKAIIAMTSSGRIGRTSGYKPDGITETLSLYTCTSMASTRDFLDAHLNTFMAPTGHGVVLYTYSLIFTSGLDNVRQDMDKMIEAPSLIGRHDYASQELVNLMLCGHAHSNVFDGTQDMGGMLLRGIPNQTNIGMLTLFEHYEHVRVGQHMKLPVYPIWVLCSESHYSVLFTPDVQEVQSDPLDRKGNHVVQLYYYDELAKQEEMYQLTVDMPEYDRQQAKAEAEEHQQNGRRKHHQQQKEVDLTPPIDHVIRTHWKGATVDWNGSEALL
jgi:hypothetical protein